MKLYTRKGDEGQTSLFDGTRVSKDDPRIEACGTIDEFSAQFGTVIGLAQSHAAEEAYRTLADRLTRIQGQLFVIGAELATPLDGRNRDEAPATSAEQAARLETWIDEATASVSPVKTFVLPGGDTLACQLHVCRTVCRRAERRVVTLIGQAPVNPQILVYLNRLSDLLFAWARLANHLAGRPDVSHRTSDGWQPDRRFPT